MTRALHGLLRCTFVTASEGRSRLEEFRKSEYEHLLATRTGPDPDDHEHSAAAISGRVDFLLSADRTGFPIRDTHPARRRHPDDYLTEIFDLFPGEILEVLHDMARSRHEPAHIDDVINALRRAGLRNFASQAVVMSKR